MAINNSPLVKVSVDYLSELAASPPIQALCQLHWISAAVNSLFSGEYHRKKEEELTEALHLLHTKCSKIEQRYVDKEFFATSEGKRVFAMAFRSLMRDSRREKLDAMTTLLANLSFKSKISYDERELYVDILDMLNPFHLVALSRIAEWMKENKPDTRRFDASGIASFFEGKGIDTQLTYQAIAVLANWYLVNRGASATFGGGGIEYYFTELGERFYWFIAEVLKNDSPYLVG